MSNPIDTSSVFVVIPAYNEHAVIGTVVTDILSYGYRPVIVDDGSSPALKDTLAHLPVYLLRHRVNLGQGASLQTGIEFALQRGASFIVTFDADGQHHAADIAGLLSPLADDLIDIVSGSRFMEGAVHNMTPGRRFMVQAARWFNFLYTGLLLSDAHNGLRAFNRLAAVKIKLRENGMAHATEILSIIKKHRLRYAEVPVTVHYSDYSKAKGQHAWSSFRVFFDLLLHKLFK